MKTNHYDGNHKIREQTDQDQIRDTQIIGENTANIPLCSIISFILENVLFSPNIQHTSYFSCSDQLNRLFYMYKKYCTSNRQSHSNGDKNECKLNSSTKLSLDQSDPHDKQGKCNEYQYILCYIMINQSLRSQHNPSHNPIVGIDINPTLPIMDALQKIHKDQHSQQMAIRERYDLLLPTFRVHQPNLIVLLCSLVKNQLSFQKQKFCRMSSKQDQPKNKSNDTLHDYLIEFSKQDQNSSSVCILNFNQIQCQSSSLINFSNYLVKNKQDYTQKYL